MGLSDFFKKGKEEPAKKPATQPISTGGKQVSQTPGNPNEAFYTNTDKQQITNATPNQDIYTVQSGDSLSKIAKKHYGDAKAWTKIYQSNKATIGDNPDLIRPGQRLVIPRT